jgi:hypothetical protein
MDRLLDAKEAVEHLAVPAAFLERDLLPALRRLIPIRVAVTKEQVAALEDADWAERLGVTRGVGVTAAPPAGEGRRGSSRHLLSRGADLGLDVTTYRRDRVRA